MTKSEWVLIREKLNDKSDWLLGIIFTGAIIWMVLAIDRSDCSQEYWKLERESYSMKQLDDFRRLCDKFSNKATADKLREGYQRGNRPEWFLAWAHGQSQVTLKRGIK
jgi:hypothetical protein